jgi:hypothetical protein
MTPNDVAEWMVGELAQRAILYQSRVATYVRRNAPDLTYRNNNGNWALNKSILDTFRKLTPGDEIVWSRSGQYWRHRKQTDKPGRMQR